MRWRGGLQVGHQSKLRPLPKMGILVRAPRGLVPELSLDCLDRVASGRGLAALETA
jgi:hypothetical protein